MATIEMLDGHDQEPSAFPVLAPNPFDKAVNAMHSRIKTAYNWDLLNPTVWKLLGTGRGKLEKWLGQYIDTAKSLKKAYEKKDWEQWKSIFVNKYYYDPALAEIYFRFFRESVASNEIPKMIYEPWLYNPSTDDKGALDNLFGKGGGIAKLALTGVAVYAGIAFALPALLRGKR